MAPTRLETQSIGVSRLVRGPDAFPESVDHWPGAKSALRGVPVAGSEEPQAKPSGVVSPPSREIEDFGGRPQGPPLAGRGLATVPPEGGQWWCPAEASPPVPGGRHEVAPVGVRPGAAARG